jgi:outer membrane receptor protein involved in Fe transport
VPTQAYRNGDFSDLLSSASPQQLYDPATTTLLPTGSYTRQTFAGNIIPFNRIDPTAQAVLALYPLPNLPGDFNNYAATVPVHLNKHWTYVFKLDHNFNANNHLSASLATTSNPQTSGGGLPAPIGSILVANYSYWFPRVSYDLTISPTMLNQVRISFNRQTQYQDTPYRSGGWPRQLGLLGFEHAVGSFPNFSLGSFTQSGMTLGYNNRTSNTFIISDAFSWTKSRHTMKFGVEARRVMTLKYLGNPAQLTFSRNETALPTQLSTTGLEFASFLLGQVDQAAQSLYGNFAPIFNSYQYALYAQDDFRFTPRLTFSYGLRYDTFTPLTKSHDWYAMINTKKPNPAAGNLPGVYIFAGKNGNGNQIAPATKDSRNFGPRFGFAYKLSNKTAVRGAYGISYFQTGAYGAPSTPRSTTDIGSLAQRALRIPV